MSRFLGILAVLAVVVLAMAFAAANAGSRATIDLGLITLYRVPVTLVAFTGLLTGMVVMFATGVYTDLKVRRILRDRLAEETQTEQRWIDGNQQDLFEGEGEEEATFRARPDETVPMMGAVMEAEAGALRSPREDPHPEEPGSESHPPEVRQEEELQPEEAHPGGSRLEKTRLDEFHRRVPPPQEEGTVSEEESPKE